MADRRPRVKAGKDAKASVVFGRLNDPEPEQTNERKLPEIDIASCCAPIERWINSLMGFPDPASRKKELRNLPKGFTRDFSDTADAERGGMQAVCSSKQKEAEGWINQDAVISCAFQRRENEDLARFLFGVCDGHGRQGHDVSGLIRERLPVYLALCSDLTTNTKKAFEDSFRDVDRDVEVALGLDVEYSGSTAVCVFVDKVSSTLHIANIGDSRAVLARHQYGKMVAMPLTVDHKPDSPDEKHRIELSYGYVSPYMMNGVPEGPARVWDSRNMIKPGLACSRSIGDGAAKQLGVISKPDVTTRTITADDKFLLIASDGLWDSVSEQEAVDMMQKFINTPSKALSSLTELVRQREEDMLVDDTTIVFVKL